MNRFALYKNHSFFDTNLVMPKHGHLYHLRGEGRAGASMRQYADAWTAMALIQGKKVHWIDGACRFNPTKILQCVPSSFPEPEQS